MNKRVIAIIMSLVTLLSGCDLHGEHKKAKSDANTNQSAATQYSSTASESENISNKSNTTSSTTKDTNKITTSSSAFINKQQAADNNIKEASEQETFIKFLEAVNKNDYEAFNNLIGTNGLNVIRRFCSGNGTRGTNFNYHYEKGELPPNLKFGVNNETPININSYFKDYEVSNGVIKNLDITVMQHEDYYFANDKKNDKQIDEFCSLLLESRADHDKYKLKAFKLENQIVLSKSQSVIGLPIGTFIFFREESKRYVLEAIVELL